MVRMKGWVRGWRGVECRSGGQGKRSDHGKSLKAVVYGYTGSLFLYHKLLRHLKMRRWFYSENFK
jgi:hypothetical protein